MASDTSDNQRIAVQNGSVIASPAPPRGRERRLGLALVVISLTQLMLVPDELIVNTALPHIHAAQDHLDEDGVRAGRAAQHASIDTWQDLMPRDICGRSGSGGWGRPGRGWPP